MYLGKGEGGGELSYHSVRRIERYLGKFIRCGRSVGTAELREAMHDM